MRTIYLDTCIIIYFVENNPLYISKVENAMKSLSNVEFCYSPLTRLETLVMPLRNKDLKLQQTYELFFNSQKFLQIDNDVYERAAQLRADFPSLKTPDALHLSTAIYHNCDEFWTNDNRLDKVEPNLVKNIL